MHKMQVLPRFSLGSAPRLIAGSVLCMAVYVFVGCLNSSMVSHLPHGGNPTDRQRLLPSGTALSLALSVTGTQPGTEAVQFAPRLVNKGADTVFITHGSNGFYVRI